MLDSNLAFRIFSSSPMSSCARNFWPSLSTLKATIFSLRIKTSSFVLFLSFFSTFPKYYLSALVCFSVSIINYALALPPFLIIYEKNNQVTRFCSRLVTPGISGATCMFTSLHLSCVLAQALMCCGHLSSHLVSPPVGDCVCIIPEESGNTMGHWEQEALRWEGTQPFVPLHMCPSYNRRGTQYPLCTWNPKFLFPVSCSHAKSTSVSIQEPWTQQLESTASEQ